MSYNLKITHKISLLITLLSVLALTLAFLGYTGLNSYEYYSKQIQSAAERASYSDKINMLVYAVVMDSRGIYMSRSAEEVEKFSKPLLENLKQMEILTGEWEKIIRPEQAESFKLLKQDIDDFIAFRTETVNRGRSTGAEAARLYGDNEKNRANRQSLNQKLKEIAQYNAEDIKTTDTQADQHYIFLLKLIVITTFIGIVSCVPSSFYIMRRFISRPLSGLSAYMEKLAKGNLQDDVPYQNRKDEVGGMVRSVTVLREGLLREKELAEQAEKQKEIDAEYRGQIQAIRKSQAVIEFNMDGTIITANDHFVNTVGYTLEEIQGKHHEMFVPPEYAGSIEYRAFWDKLRRGEYDNGEYKRLGKNGKEIWIQASYNPIMTSKGVPFKVVKFATDVTDLKLKNADFEGQINAINKSQAVIHFNMDGTIIQANDSFLNFMGYSLDEIRGQHHRMFVKSEEAASKDYHDFWENLKAGNFDARVFKRVTKAGREVWIQASYNPIFDLNGKPFKVVKYASDVTDMINLTDQTGTNVQAVAAATEELSASIEEISSNMSLSKQSTDEIVEKTKTSGEASDRLVQTTKQMEEIVNLIRDIAEQVNLLALNATIEAARAGDAGKGFAVVANEVKNLANQTAQATDDIAREISEVQFISADVAQAIGNIISSAESVNQYVTSVAGAIEEQSIIIKDISKNSQNTSNAVMLISEQIKKRQG